MIIPPFRGVSKTARTLRGRWQVSLTWLMVPAVIILLSACAQETVLDHKVTPSPTQIAVANEGPAEGGTQGPDATASPNAVASPSNPSGDAVSLNISVNGDLLEFDIVSLEVASGSEVALAFTNISAFNQHNWVLVEAGTKDDVAIAGAAAGLTNDWIPEDDARVLARSSLLDPGAEELVRFTAPAEGSYQFVCTFPGHNLTMFGDFVVGS